MHLRYRCLSSTVLAFALCLSLGPTTSAQQPDPTAQEPNKSEAAKPAEQKPEPEKQAEVEKKPEGEKKPEKKPESEKKPEGETKASDAATVTQPAGPKLLPVYGYTNTPLIPGQPWHIHDLYRPHPPVVSVGDAGTPSSDAVVLFDGHDLSAWGHRGEKPSDISAARWTVGDGYFEVLPNSGNLQSLENFGSCQLHIEWATPEKVEGHSQARGNSGVLFMGLFEVQILDSYMSRTYADGQAGALYGMHPPLVNASHAPGQWQSYDIVFEAPLYEGDTLVRKASATVFHNGLIVQHKREFTGHTTHKELQTYSKTPPAGPLVLQDHKNPVRFRNIWIRPLPEN